MYDKIVAAAGPNKLEELEADKCCADRLRAAHELALKCEEKDSVLKQVQNIIARVKAENPDADNRQLMEAVGRASGARGHQARAASDFEDFVFQAEMKIDRKGYLEGRPIVLSHVDLDSRLSICMDVAYGDVRERDVMSPLLLDNRTREKRYREARADTVLAAGDEDALAKETGGPVLPRLDSVATL